MKSPKTYQYLPVVMLLLIVVGGTIYYRDLEENVLILATTTSVENAGLFDILIAEYARENQVSIKIIARGTGAAIDLAERGEVDAILVHAPDLEMQFVNDGFGINRTTLWYNYFIIVGPENDPAGAMNTTDLNDAFKKIKLSGEASETAFYSRGDESGTHIKELQIWANSTIDIQNEKGNWYIETGSGMAATLTITNENLGYSLSDLGTFLQLRENLAGFELVVNEIPNDITFNPYSYILISPAKYSHVNVEEARLFLEFLKLESTNNLVRNYKVNNRTLFVPIGDLE